MNYKQRMLEELIDLTQKLERLRECDRTLSEKEIKLLDEQEKTMEQYHQILKERLMLILNDSEFKTISAKIEPSISLLNDRL